MENIWWNQVTNAVRYVDDIKMCLLEEKSILLKYSNAIPWHDQFEESVKDAVKLQNSEKKFIDVPVVDEPGEYLLNELCKKEKRTEYRPSKGYARFFAENDDIVLHDRYLWVEIDNTTCLDRWISFVSDYIKLRGKKANNAVFVLEWIGTEQTHLKKGIKVFSFDDYIGDYDRIVFSVLASSGIRESVFISDYLAELVSNVSGNDIELSAECIAGYKSFFKNPLSFIKETVNTKTRSDGTCFTYEKGEVEVDHLIWLSQIRTVYPRLEEFREEFVSKHSSEIAQNLPLQTFYGEVITDPEDVELGTLVYMAGNGLLRLKTSEYERLKNYKEARNKLSHLGKLSIDEIKGLI